MPCAGVHIWRSSMAKNGIQQRTTDASIPAAFVRLIDHNHYIQSLIIHIKWMLNSLFACSIEMNRRQTAYNKRYAMWSKSLFHFRVTGKYMWYTCTQKKTYYIRKQQPASAQLFARTPNCDTLNMDTTHFVVVVVVVVSVTAITKCEDFDGVIMRRFAAIS